MEGDWILVVDDDDAMRGLIKSTLSSRGHHVEVAPDGQQALQAIHQGTTPPALVITDVRMPHVDGLELTRRLRTNHRTAHVPIMILSSRKQAEEVLAGYTQGADEYVPKPVEMPVLAAKVESMLRRARAAAPAETSLRTGTVVVFLHGKGGVGTTTLAVNVAVALVLSGSYPVSVVDLDLEFGNVPLMLNLAPKHTLAEVASSLNERAEDSVIEEVLLRHASNIWVVPGSDQPENAGLVTPPAVEQALARLRDRSEYVIVDMAASFSEINLAALDGADLICVTASPQIASLKATADSVSVLNKLSVPNERVLLILNQITTQGLNDRQVATFLGRSPDFVLPHTPQFDEAANAGKPFITAFPSNVSSHRIREIAAKISLVASALANQRDTEETPRAGSVRAAWQ